MKISDLRSWAVVDQGLPLSETIILLAHVLKISKENIFSTDNIEVSEYQKNAFEKLVNRRISGEPIAYLRNSKEFYGKSFFVDERVLIPRPETELIVDSVLDLFKSDNMSEHVTIADVGTGSGSLALTLARVLPHSHVHALDVSASALDVAEKNRADHELTSRVTLHIGDLLTPLIAAKIAPDIIVANLPYIPLNDVENVEPSVHNNEPHLALYSGETGLEHYEKMFAQLPLLPNLPRYILGEFGFGQTESLQTLINETVIKLIPSDSLSPITSAFLPDLAGIPRVFLISLPRLF